VNEYMIGYADLFSLERMHESVVAHRRLFPNRETRFARYNSHRPFSAGPANGSSRERDHATSSLASHPMSSRFFPAVFLSFSIRIAVPQLCTASS